MKIISTKTTTKKVIDNKCCYFLVQLAYIKFLLFILYDCRISKDVQNLYIYQIFDSLINRIIVRALVQIHSIHIYFSENSKKDYQLKNYYSSFLTRMLNRILRPSRNCQHKHEDVTVYVRVSNIYILFIHFEIKYACTKQVRKNKNFLSTWGLIL